MTPNDDAVDAVEITLKDVRDARDIMKAALIQTALAHYACKHGVCFQGAGENCPAPRR